MFLKNALAPLFFILLIISCDPTRSPSAAPSNNEGPSNPSCASLGSDKAKCKLRADCDFDDVNNICKDKNSGAQRNADELLITALYNSDMADTWLIPVLTDLQEKIKTKLKAKKVEIKLCQTTDDNCLTDNNPNLSVYLLNITTDRVDEMYKKDKFTAHKNKIEGQNIPHDLIIFRSGKNIDHYKKATFNDTEVPTLYFYNNQLNDDDWNKNEITAIAKKIKK